MEQISLNGAANADDAGNADGTALDLLNDLTSSFALSVLNSSPDCIKLVELDGSLSFMNRNGMCAMEIDDFAMVEAQPWPSLWPVEAQPQLEAAVTAAVAGQTTRFEAFCPTAKGAPRWWSVTVSPVRNAAGETERVLASSRDITEQVNQMRVLNERDLQLSAYAERLAVELSDKDQLLEENRLLLREIDHRVKNNFAMICGMLRLQARGLDDASARFAVDDAAGRVMTLSYVHEQLYSGAPDAVELPDYLPRIARSIVGALSAEVEAVAADVATVTVEPDIAVALGLVTAELCSNAVKHAGRPAPRIALRLEREGCDLVLSISDDGPGLPDGFAADASTGLGMRVCKVQARQLGGTLHFDAVPDGGALISLRFPAPA
ncbi:sensor histidine kinase [Pontivivens ytuae]|uniref:histidine kinase n=1 Tax=Pontivivens ytuae TaxID=2789856 RepID=A0A7S9LPA1_9RHOB|nr:PAS domain-containing protein [Pontivivens ytuae]QPH52749.1 PAS domain-containing protein [Pontivivens ytuae]